MLFTIFNFILTGLCLFGTWGNANQKRWGFTVWIITNSIYMSMDLFMYHNYGRALLFAVQTGMCIVGLLKWKEIEERLNDSNKA